MNNRTPRSDSVRRRRVARLVCISVLSLLAMVPGGIAASQAVPVPNAPSVAASAAEGNALLLRVRAAWKGYQSLSATLEQTQQFAGFDEPLISRGSSQGSPTQLLRSPVRRPDPAEADLRRDMGLDLHGGAEAGLQGPARSGRDAWRRSPGLGHGGRRRDEREPPTRALPRARCESSFSPARTFRCVSFVCGCAPRRRRSSATRRSIRMGIAPGCGFSIFAAPRTSSPSSSASRRLPARK